MPKDTEKKKVKKEVQRHTPLEQQIKDSEVTFKKPKAKPNVSKKSKEKEKEKETQFINSGLTQKILGLAQSQSHHDEEDEDDVHESSKALKFKKGLKLSKIEVDESDDDSELGEGDYHIEELDAITEEDERALKMFMSNDAPKRVTLADVIMEKIKEKESGMADDMDMAEQHITSTLDPKIIEAYKNVGNVLSHFKSGKLPKVFKIIPSLSNWEEIIFLTTPENWSPAATRQATKIFASNLNAKMAQKFYSLILLNKVLDDIKEHKKLNFHYYLSLKKALFKPAAFFKGFLFPLCESGECTLRGAVIVGSVLSKVSIPVLHSSAAILKIAEMSYSGVNSYFLSILLNKKYALPYRVIDALVQHFSQFTDETKNLPVLWHQALLIFVQRYKTDLTQEQKDILKGLGKIHYHSFFAEEVRRELTNSKCRGEVAGAEMEVS